jgi:hypothetical protein
MKRGILNVSELSNLKFLVKQSGSLECNLPVRYLKNMQKSVSHHACVPESRRAHVF